jgi:hypothetical protein
MVRVRHRDLRRVRSLLVLVLGGVTACANIGSHDPGASCSGQPDCVADAGGDRSGGGADAATGEERCVDVACENGTCNLATGACECAPGYQGAACGELAPPPSSSLVLWLDANDPLGDGGSAAAGPLPAWSDKAAGLVFTASGDHRPSIRFTSGLGTAEFDGNDFMVASNYAALNGASAYTVVVAASAKAGATQDLLSGIRDGKHGLLVEVATTGQLRFLHRMPFASTPGTGTDLRSADSSFGPALTVALLVRDAAQNSFSITIGDDTVTSPAGATNFNENLEVVLGKINALAPTQNDRFLDGSIAEILIYDTHLTAEQSEQILRYLSLKWTPSP